MSCHGWLSAPAASAFADQGAQAAWERALPALWESYYRCVGQVVPKWVSSVADAREGVALPAGVWSLDGYACACQRGCMREGLSGDFETSSGVGRDVSPCVRVRKCSPDQVGADLRGTRREGLCSDVLSDKGEAVGSDSCGLAGGVGQMGLGSAFQDRGRHWKKNKAKKEKKKAMARSWRPLNVDGSGGCVSEGSTASVCTVDTRTAVEIQAAQSLAARRVVENQIAIARGKMQLKGFGDKAKTDALQRLAAARMEQRINEAKAKSQASFRKCDESLKSLGSTGSAGEFAMRCEVQKARRSEDMLKYVQEQADILVKYASPEVLAMCREVKPPEPIDIFEIFGECSSDLSPEEASGYYEELQRMQEEEDERSAVYY